MSLASRITNKQEAKTTLQNNAATTHNDGTFHPKQSCNQDSSGKVFTARVCEVTIIVVRNTRLWHQKHPTKFCLEP